MERWANIAVLLKAKDAEGGLFVKATKGLPFLLTEGLEVTFVPPVLRVPRSARVASISQTHDNRLVVYFEGITSREISEQLVGHSCLVRRSDVPAEAFQDKHSLVGYTVVDQAYGTVGQVVRVEENPAHPLLVVKPLDSYACQGGMSAGTSENAAFSDQSTEYLIPLVDEFVCDIDEDALLLTLRLPEGILEL